MPGVITFKELAAVTLQNDNGVTILAGKSEKTTTATLDNRSGGNGAQCTWMNFELKAAFNTSTVLGFTVELYLVPYLDGTNSASMGVLTQSFQPSHFAGHFYVILSQAGVQRLNVLHVPMMPMLYDVYLLNRTAINMVSGWGLRMVPVQQQFS